MCVFDFPFYPLLQLFSGVARDFFYRGSMTLEVLSTQVLPYQQLRNRQKPCGAWKFLLLSHDHFVLSITLPLFSTSVPSFSTLCTVHSTITQPSCYIMQTHPWKGMFMCFTHFFFQVKNTNGDGSSTSVSMNL